MSVVGPRLTQDLATGLEVQLTLEKGPQIFPSAVKQPVAFENSIA